MPYLPDLSFRGGMLCMFYTAALTAIIQRMVIFLVGLSR